MFQNIDFKWLYLERCLKQINWFNKLWSCREKNKAQELIQGQNWVVWVFLKTELNKEVQYKECDPNTEIISTENFWNCSGFLVNIHNIDRLK